VEFVAAVAVGLNPYIGTFVLTALAAFTDHVPAGAFMQMTPPLLLSAVAALTALAAPFDFIFGKFVRFAPLVRKCSQSLAPVAGAMAAATVTESSLPLPLVAVGGAVLSWTVAAMLTALAARASRSAAWVGLGHIPVLMAAATAAACIVPLGLAKPAIGYVLSALALALVGGVTLLGQRAGQRSAAPAQAVTRRAAGAARAAAR
jgi:hypothetical protein